MRWRAGLGVLGAMKAKSFIVASALVDRETCLAEEAIRAWEARRPLKEAGGGCDSGMSRESLKPNAAFLRLQQGIKCLAFVPLGTLQGFAAANAAVFNHMPRHRAFNNLGKCKLDMMFFSCPVCTCLGS